MSTGDALLHAAASILVKDLWHPLRDGRGRATDRDETTLIRSLVVAIGGLAYCLAMVSEASLVYLLLVSYGAIAQIFPLVIAALYWRRSTTTGVVTGLIAGCLVTLIWNLFPELQWQGIHPGVWGLVVNVTATILVSLATPAMRAEHVDQFLRAN
jgi:SSS family solute:Na+ symporter